MKRLPLFLTGFIVAILGGMNLTTLDSFPQTFPSWSLALEPTNSSSYDLLLSVPFYVYQELNWLETGTIGNQTFFAWLQARHSISHNDDLQFLLAALQHPMRTHRPEEAKLFVVPFLSSVLALWAIYPSKLEVPCVKTTCGKDLMLYVDDFLSKTKWFQRNGGNDHLATITFFGFDHKYLGGNLLYRNLMNCHIIQFGEDQKLNEFNRLAFNTFYVGRKCPWSRKTSDLTMIARLTRVKRMFNRKLQTRRDVCRWIRAETNYSMPICGVGQRCPALAEARYGFHVRGDSYGSSRLMDTLLSGTVPIFTSKEQFDLMPPWFDWEHLSYFVPVANKTSFLRSLSKILAEDKSIYQTKLNNVLENSDLFDWETPIPFDTYMYMLQAHLWPELRRNQSRYSALILPPITDSISGAILK